MTKKPRIVFIRTNSFASEPRLIKEYGTLESQYDCWLLLWDRNQTHESQRHAYYLRLSAPYGKWLFAIYQPVWIVYCFAHLIKLRPQAIHACDLEGVVPAYCYSRFFRCVLVYDIWDALIGRFPAKTPLFRKLICGLERYFIFRCDQVLIPDPERLLQLHIPKRNQKKFTIIYNSDEAPTKKQVIHLAPNQSLHFVYVGVMSQKIRGLEFLIPIAKCFPGYTFSIAGYGPDAAYFTRLFRLNPLPNLKSLGQVSRDQAHKLYRQSDIILSLLDPTFPNYQYATSTKAFEAFAYAKPVITTRHTATGTLIKRCEWGLVIDYSESTLKQALTTIQTQGITFRLDPARVASYVWPSMAKRLQDVYARLLCH